VLIYRALSPLIGRQLVDSLTHFKETLHLLLG